MRHRHTVCSAAILAVATIAGCSASTADDAQPSIDTAAIVDPATGTIAFPGDRYELGEKRMLSLDAARDVIAAECAAQEGVTFLPSVSAYPEEYEYSTYFGVWTADVAERYAFANPMTEADMAASGILVNGEPVDYTFGQNPVSENRAGLSDADWEVVAACQKEPDAARFDSMAAVGDGPWLREFGDVAFGFMQSPEAQEIETDYEECLAERGLEPHPEVPGNVKGADRNAINAEQIELALEVVACKDDVDYIQRLADALAAKQAPIIEEYATELLAHGQQLDELLAEAEEVVAEYKATQ